MLKNSLPIDDVLPDFLDKLRRAGAVVLEAPTGAGKTTRVPPAILEAGLAGERQVVVLEPRRVAARAAARRMAEENGWKLGEEIGYQIRFDRKASGKTRILVVTEGILVGMLQRDPFLEEIGAVVFDEFHERNLQSDLALAMTRRVRREVREDLRIAVMSATLDPGPIAAYLDDCPRIKSEGRLYPVTIHHLDRPDDRRLEHQVASAVRQVLEDDTDPPGDVLVFLPGVGEIHRAGDALKGFAKKRDLAVMPLYGDLPPEKQDAVLKPGGRRKVVLATNVAETSITIDGVSTVVDSGLERRMRFDPASGLDRLELGRISRASAEQRAGRAGRQGPGLCLRLWTEHDERSLQEREAPEIRRVDLAGPALELLAWGENDLAAFDWFEAPEPTALEHALELLQGLGALGEQGLTEIGRAMAKLPLHPRLGRLLIAGHTAGSPRRAALLAALVSERDIVTRGLGTRPEAAVAGRSDLLDRLEGVEQVAAHGHGDCALGPVHTGRAHHVMRVGRQLEKLARRVLGRPAKSPADDETTLLRALLDAYPDRVTRRRGKHDMRAVMIGGRGVRLGDESVVKEAELFVAVELGGGKKGGTSGGTSGGARGEAWVRLASAIERDWLSPEAIKTHDEILYDAELDRVIGRRQSLYHDLLLDETEVPPSAEDAAAALAVAASEDLERALPLGDAAVTSFLARARCLTEWMPELELPAFDDDHLRQLLPHLAAGRRSFADLRRAPLLEILQGTLGYEQLETIERHAPERLEVPSGSRIRLDYEPGKPPVLAARIQELFGLAETPRVAAGKVPVTMHLLAPNMRPQQVTQDLESFWERTYPEVKKELQGRYPKHAWPDDPWNATPERRPRRRRSKSHGGS